MISEDSLHLIPSPSISVKIQTMGGKGVKSKHCWFCQQSFENKKFVDITQQYMPYYLSGQLFEFSLKLKVMGSNPGCLLKSFLLHIKWSSFESFAFKNVQK